MIIDVFMFNDDFDMLDCRLYQLDGIVDRFVVIEGNMSFSGIPKPYLLSEAVDRYALTPMDIVTMDLSDAPVLGQYGGWVIPGTERAWDREGYQRNGAAEVLNQYPMDAVVIFGDIDEIPRPEVIREFDRAPSVMLMFHLVYSTQNMYPAPWFGPTIGIRKDMSTALGMRDTRFQRPPIRNAGWHLSWFGKNEDRVRKMHQHTHMELVGNIGDAIGEGLPSAHKHMDGTSLVPYRGDLPRWITDGHAPESWTQDW